MIYIPSLKLWVFRTSVPLSRDLGRLPSPGFRHFHDCAMSAWHDAGLQRRFIQRWRAQ